MAINIDAQTVRGWYQVSWCLVIGETLFLQSSKANW